MPTESGFARAIPLPAEVKAEEAKATLQDGVLEVRLPKSERAPGRRHYRADAIGREWGSRTGEAGASPVVFWKRRWAG